MDDWRRDQEMYYEPGDDMPTWADWQSWREEESWDSSVYTTESVPVKNPAALRRWLERP